jgi:hypothetical protein
MKFAAAFLLVTTIGLAGCADSRFRQQMNRLQYGDRSVQREAARELLGQGNETITEAAPALAQYYLSELELYCRAQVDEYGESDPREFRDEFGGMPTDPGGDPEPVLALKKVAVHDKSAIRRRMTRAFEDIDRELCIRLALVLGSTRDEKCVASLLAGGLVDYANTFQPVNDGDFVARCVTAQRALCLNAYGKVTNTLKTLLALEVLSLVPESVVCYEHLGQLHDLFLYADDECVRRWAEFDINLLTFRTFACAETDVQPPGPRHTDVFAAADFLELRAAYFRKWWNGLPEMQPSAMRAWFRRAALEELARRTAPISEKDMAAIRAIQKNSDKEWSPLGERYDAACLLDNIIERIAYSSDGAVPPRPFDEPTAPVAESVWRWWQENGEKLLSHSGNIVFFLPVTFYSYPPLEIWQEYIK